MLVERVCGTLVSTGYDMSRIINQPAPLPNADSSIFEKLCLAILSSAAQWTSIEKKSKEIRRILFYYNVDKLANISDAQIGQFYTNKFKPLRIAGGPNLRNKLKWIRNNAKVFRDIRNEHGSFHGFLLNYVRNNQQDDLRKWAIARLWGVGKATCSEFFNNIGIDEFKPDTHTNRFLKRIGLVDSESQDAAREVGMAIAGTLGTSCKYVDSVIWSFCAEGEGKICTASRPKCESCLLKLQEPVLCEWTSCSAQIETAFRRNEKG